MRRFDATLLRRPVLPFVGITGLAFATTRLQAEGNWRLILIAAGLTAVTAVAALVVPWRRLPPSTALALPIACDGILSLLRHAQGGSTSGYSPLAILPVVWVGLAFRRRAVAAIVACTSAMFGLPIALIGPPEYPATGWRGALLWTIAAAVVGLAANRVVAEQRRQGRLAWERARKLNRLVRTQTAIATAEFDLDAVMNAVVSEALLLTAGDGAAIELPEGDEMVKRAVAGSAADYAGARVTQAQSISGMCLRTAEVLVSDDTELDERVDRDACRRLGVRSMVVVPLVHDGRAAGVLKVHAPAPGVMGPDDAQVLALLANIIGTALVRAELVEKLAAQARTDDLTGLPNRRVWDDRLADALARAERSGSTVSVAVFDLDGFKAVNDVFGHAAGDRVLRAVAAAWIGISRAGDLLARIGGDEFGLLLEDTDDVDALRAVERLLAVLPAGQTASAGVARWDGSEDAASLTERADARMYDEKRGKRVVG